MKKILLQWLCCPDCRGDFALYGQDFRSQDEELCEIDCGSLECVSCKAIFPITKGIPRFVSKENYAVNFGFQWNIFKKTQLDSYTKAGTSRYRFYRQSEWKPDEMKGAIVLDAGCGAGRFCEVALSTGANVIAVDYSEAVDACRENLKKYKNLHVVQADIYKLPFRPDFFDYVYSFGVLQHMPDVKKAFFELTKKVKNNGKLCVDFYRKDWKVFFWPKYWLRPVTRNLPPESLLRIVKKAVPLLLPISRLLSKIPKYGRYLKYIIPVANHEGVFSLSKKHLLEWAILDTFDMFSAKYDSPQNEKTVMKWFKEIDFSDVSVLNYGIVVARGTKKAS